MNEAKQALLLVGSARRPRSTSEAMGTYLLERLGEQGFVGETVILHRAGRTEQGREELLKAVDQADVVVLSFPLYVDSLPATVIRALELIDGHRAEGSKRPSQRLLAIVNSGFPEAEHNDTAAAICRQFAREAGFEWSGALMLGGGGSIAGRPLEEVGGAARFAIAALDLAAGAIAEGRPLPDQAVTTMATPMIPGWAYRAMGWLGWRMQARQNGVLGKLKARPYES